MYRLTKTAANASSVSDLRRHTNDEFRKLEIYTSDLEMRLADAIARITILESTP